MIPPYPRPSKTMTHVPTQTIVRTAIDVILVVLIGAAISALAFALTGCMANIDTRPAPRGTLTLADEYEIETARQQWCKLTPCCPPSAEILVVTPAECKAATGVPCSAYFRRRPYEIALALGRIDSYSRLRSFAAHEYGHACGLDHANTTAAVMHPQAYAAGVSSADVAQCLAVPFCANGGPAPLENGS